MNYIREINAFYDWLELNELSQSSVLLWHALMHLNNKSGWQESFTVARSVIEAKSGLKKDAYYNARNQLYQKGLIKFKERKNKATVFQMMSLSEKQTATQTTTPTATQTTTPTATQTIIKLNETKQNKNTSSSSTHTRATAFFVQNFGNHSMYIQEKIADWEKSLSEDIVIASMKIALEKNARSFSYCESILKEWFAEGLQTLDEVRAYELEKKQKKKTNWHSKGKNQMPRAFQSLQEWAEEG